MSDDAIPAATLVVWRDTPAEPEILVVERAAGMAFAAGAIVFPGGRIDAADRALAQSFGSPDDAAKITAIRETIEESAVIAGLAGPVAPSLGRQLQDELLGGADFADL
jgi:8-oxo-dGTP pyrophosphatase MutT (NUDIX family)